MVAILVISIKIEKLSAEKKIRWKNISGRQIIDLGTISQWRRWRSRQRWHWVCCALSVLVKQRCTRSFAPPACLWILWGATLTKKAPVHVVMTKHSLVGFYYNLHLYTPQKFNSLFFLFSDFGGRIVDQVLRFLIWGTRIPFFDYFGHIQGQAHVGVF